MVEAGRMAGRAEERSVRALRGRRRRQRRPELDRWNPMDPSHGACCLGTIFHRAETPRPVDAASPSSLCRAKALLTCRTLADADRCRIPRRPPRGPQPDPGIETGIRPRSTSATNRTGRRILRRRETLPPSPRRKFMRRSETRAPTGKMRRNDTDRDGRTDGSRSAGIRPWPGFPAWAGRSGGRRPVSHVVDRFRGPTTDNAQNEPRAHAERRGGPGGLQAKGCFN